jgi:hypothetical protein
MPKTIAKFKCKICNDIFTAQSDKYYTCKCGMSEVRPEEISTYYQKDKGIQFERLIGEDKTYYNEDDVYIMSGEILNLFNEMESLCQELDFHIYKSFEEDENDKKYLYYISYTKSDYLNSNSDEVNEFEFTQRFTKYTNEKEFKIRLIKFINFLKQIKNGDIDICNRKLLISDSLELDYNSKQLKKYDYIFYF